MLKAIAVWYLRKRRCSVLIGFEIRGGYLRSLNNHTFTYDLKGYNVDYRTVDDEPFIIPEGKFNVSKPDKKGEV